MKIVAPQARGLGSNTVLRQFERACKQASGKPHAAVKNLEVGNSCSSLRTNKLRLVLLAGKET